MGAMFPSCQHIQSSLQTAGKRSGYRVKYIAEERFPCQKPWLHMKSQCQLCHNIHWCIDIALYLCITGSHTPPGRHGSGLGYLAQISTEFPRPKHRIAIQSTTKKQHPARDFFIIRQQNQLPIRSKARGMKLSKQVYEISNLLDDEIINCL